MNFQHISAMQIVVGTLLGATLLAVLVRYTSPRRSISRKRLRQAVQAPIHGLLVTVSGPAAAQVRRLAGIPLEHLVAMEDQPDEEMQRHVGDVHCRALLRWLETNAGREYLLRFTGAYRAGLLVRLPLSQTSKVGRLRAGDLVCVSGSLPLETLCALLQQAKEHSPTPHEALDIATHQWIDATRSGQRWLWRTLRG